MEICKDRKGADKRFHFWLSFALGAVFGGLNSLIPYPTPWLAVCVTFALAFGIGIAKEVRDSRKPGNHFCVWDTLADLLGVLLSLPIAYFARYFTE